MGLWNIQDQVEHDVRFVVVNLQGELRVGFVSSVLDQDAAYTQSTRRGASSVHSYRSQILKRSALVILLVQTSRF